MLENQKNISVGQASEGLIKIVKEKILSKADGNKDAVKRTSNTTRKQLNAVSYFSNHEDKKSFLKQMKDVDLGVKDIGRATQVIDGQSEESLTSGVARQIVKSFKKGKAKKWLLFASDIKITSKFDKKYLAGKGNRDNLVDDNTHCFSSVVEKKSDTNAINRAILTNILETKYPKLTDAETKNMIINEALSFISNQATVVPLNNTKTTTAQQHGNY